MNAQKTIMNQAPTKGKLWNLQQPWCKPPGGRGPLSLHARIKRDSIEEKTPAIHEIVMLDDAAGLTNWLAKHPGDLDTSFLSKTPLIAAVRYNSWKCFNILVDRHASIEEYNSYNETALLIAISRHRIEMVQRLLRAGANIYALNRGDDTATVLTIRLDDVEILSLLHSHENHLLEHDLMNKNYPLECAVTYRARKCFAFIIGLKPSAQSFLIRREDHCPILRAIKSNDPDSLKELAKLKHFRGIINEPIKNPVLTTYLHIAVVDKRCDIVEILLKNGAYKRANDGNGDTPLHLAPTVEIAKLLLEKRNFFLDINNDGEDPLMNARKRVKSSVFQFLRVIAKEWNIDPNQQTERRENLRQIFNFAPGIIKIQCPLTRQPGIGLRNNFPLPPIAPTEAPVLCPTATESESSRNEQSAPQPMHDV